MTVTVDTNGRYRTLQWHAGGKAPSWSPYGTKVFESKPACALRENVTATRPGFVLAGKATDDKLYASAGTMAAATTSQQNVTANEMWTEVSADVYTTGGSPALGYTFGGFGGDGVVLTFMANDARTIYAHSRHVPYLENDWSSRIMGPRLPSGWTAVGAPAIHSLPATFRIMVHAQSGTSHRLFETYFFLDDGDGYFSTPFGSTPAVWTQLSSLGTIEDDPAITFISGFGTTVYFRRGSEIRQTTESTSFHSTLAIKPNEAVEFASAPAATGGFGFDQGMHVVVARTTANQIYFPNQSTTSTSSRDGERPGAATGAARAGHDVQPRVDACSWRGRIFARSRNSATAPLATRSASAACFEVSKSAPRRGDAPRSFLNACPHPRLRVARS